MYLFHKHKAETEEGREKEERMKGDGRGEGVGRGEEENWGMVWAFEASKTAPITQFLQEGHTS